MTDPRIQFRDALQVEYGQLDWLPVADGNIHRFHVPGDKPNTQNGAYALQLDGIPSGWFGTWKKGQWNTWSSRALAFPIEVGQVRQRNEQHHRQREIERHQRQTNAAEYARDLVSDAGPADPYHPYLFRKGCLPHGLRQRGDLLLVLLYHAGRLVNLQRIGSDGHKRFLFGGRVRGCYSPLGRIHSGQPLYICEGWATGATLHEETGHAVACAMTAGNLLAVAEHLHQRYPNAALIIAGDDDRLTSGNPGRTAAINAAEALRCGLVLPPWCGNEPLTLSDFNDLRQWRTRQ